MNVRPGWQSAEGWPELREDQVHLWRAQLDSAGLELASWLAPDEISRAHRFHREVDRNRFVTGRGFLRLVLANYSATHPKQIRFGYSPRGKPALLIQFGERPIEFNLAHSDGWAVYAVSLGLPLGIDLERLRPIPEWLDISQQFFSPAETEQILQLDPADQPLGFFRCWTRKEALLKAVGLGLSGSLRDFTVSISTPLLQESKLPELDGWHLDEFAPEAGFVGALAVPKEKCQVQLWSRLEEFAAARQTARSNGPAPCAV